jgi:nucleotide-binding universal stress UspA family protein
MKKILVPCDFSRQAVNAFRFALDCARKSGGEVHLVHVIELPILHDSVLMPVLSFEEAYFKELEANSDVEFKKLIKKYKEAEDRVSSTTQFGTTSRMILDYINKHKIDLVVMGTKGVSGAEEVFIGSNTEKIVRNSTVPVIAIKNYSKTDFVRKIVFPNTLQTEMQEDLIKRVKALQEFFKAHLHIVFINTPAHFTTDLTTNKRLQAFTKHFLFKDFSVHVFNDFHEEDGVINFARQIKADMIALGTNSRKGLAHVISGSITEDVVNHAELPIWTYTLKND